MWPVVLLPVAIMMMMGSGEDQRPKVERVLEASPSKSAEPMDTQEGATTEEKPTPQQLYVTVNVANLRSEPSTESAVVAKLKQDDKVVEFGREEDWVNVSVPSANYATGWIYAPLLNSNETPPGETASYKSAYPDPHILEQRERANKCYFPNKIRDHKILEFLGEAIRGQNYNCEFVTRAQFSDVHRGGI